MGLAAPGVCRSDHEVQHLTQVCDGRYRGIGRSFGGPPRKKYRPETGALSTHDVPSRIVADEQGSVWDTPRRLKRALDRRRVRFAIPDLHTEHGGIDGLEKAVTGELCSPRRSPGCPRECWTRWRFARRACAARQARQARRDREPRWRRSAPGRHSIGRFRGAASVAASLNSARQAPVERPDSRGRGRSTFSFNARCKRSSPCRLAFRVRAPFTQLRRKSDAGQVGSLPRRSTTRGCCRGRRGQRARAFPV